MGEVQGVFETSMDEQVVFSSLPPMDEAGVGAIRMGEAAHAWGMSNDFYGQAGAGWNMTAPMVWSTTLVQLPVAFLVSVFLTTEPRSQKVKQSKEKVSRHLLNRSSNRNRHCEFPPHYFLVP